MAFEFLKKLLGNAVPRGRVTAIIAAAGSGTRMGEDYPDGKQLIALRGEPVIAHTLRAFQAAESIDEIVIVARSEDILSISEVVRGIGASKVTQITEGGETRQQSVGKGLSAITEDSAYIAIHDGARPLIRPELIDQAVEEAMKNGAAAVGVSVKDTLKHISADGFVSVTVDRESLVQIQTPQIFERKTYEEGLALAENEKACYTDDCQLYERLGKKIKLVEGDYENIKITTPADLTIAEAVLERRNERC